MTNLSPSPSLSLSLSLSRYVHTMFNTRDMQSNQTDYKFIQRRDGPNLMKGSDVHTQVVRWLLV